MAKLSLGTKKKTVPSKAKVSGIKRKPAKSEKGEALEAIEAYKEARSTLEEMKEEFTENFPEAHTLHQEILKQEDAVMDLIGKAKLKVREARETIEDFVCSIKHSQPTYDGAEVLKIANELEDPGEILAGLLEAGGIKTIAFNQDAIAWFAKNPEAAEVFQPAFREKQEMTPAVTVPKL